MAEATNLFVSPQGLADFAILHEPRRWDEKLKKFVPDPEGEFSTGLVIGNDEGKHFKTIVDGYVQKKFTACVEEAFAELKKNKPKKVAKYKDAMDWQNSENVFTTYYPYKQVEADDGEPLDAWRFKFKRKALIRYKDKDSGQMKTSNFQPKFADQDGSNLDANYFEENGLIGNESEMRIRFKPYPWKTPNNMVGVSLEIYHVQIKEHIPYTSNGNGAANSNEPLFDAI